MEIEAKHVRVSKAKFVRYRRMNAMRKGQRYARQKQPMRETQPVKLQHSTKVMHLPAVCRCQAQQLFPCTVLVSV